MDMDAIEARRAYKREWNRKNPDKVRASQERFWRKKAAEREAAQAAEQDDGSGEGEQP